MKTGPCCGEEGGCLRRQMENELSTLSSSFAATVRRMKSPFSPQQVSNIRFALDEINLAVNVMRCVVNRCDEVKK